ncbi:putative carboxylesterase [Medicago truncatula]|uniref:Carboxylesterase-like protein n=1 Tax=Medicago truncatula TaxID=3880 RepID=G7KNW4_MEDTR|nr:probable carboxylesterase 18 [Medicago truncatula]AES75948.1 carboxylesterase-like protein [Medicago truncatula]RHN52147.1 putative carboxylesterase [Medicago truncatula]
MSDSTPLLPWKARATISLLSLLFDASSRSNGTVNRRLFNFFSLNASPNSTPVNGVSTKDITVNTENNVWFRLFTPTVAGEVAGEVTGDGGATKTTSLPVIIYFHGGGFSFLSPSSIYHDALCRRLCREVFAVVVSVNYRLTPEHRYPSQYDDGEAVLKFLEENKTVLPENADVSKCFLAGDSSGANLAHHLTVRVCKAGLREIRIIGLVSIQPFFGGEERTEAEIKLDGSPLVSMARTDWWWKVFLPEGSNRDHGAVNVSGPNAEDLSGLDFPETIVFIGGFDPLNDWQKRYYNWLKKCGKKAELIEYPNMVHVFYIFPDLPESTQLIMQVKDFISKVSNSRL